MRPASLARLTRAAAPPAARRSIPASRCSSPILDSNLPRRVSRCRSFGRVQPLSSLSSFPPSASAAPSPNHGAPSTIATLLDSKPDQPVPDVVVNGYILSVRKMKNVSFAMVNDGSSLSPLQAVIPSAQVHGLSVGAAVSLTGVFVASEGGGQTHELHVDSVQLVGPSDAKTYPLQKKYHTVEHLRTIPHIRPRRPYNAAILRLRSDAISALTQFFASQDFTQTHPPIITSSDCEGAGETFTVTPSTTAWADEPFFRAPKYLTVSTQLHLEALAQAVGNVWTLSPTFRAERSDTSRHLAEFYMLEAEMTFVDTLDGVMDVTESAIRNMVTTLFTTRTAQELFARDGTPSGAEIRRQWERLMRLEWPRISYTDVLRELATATDFEGRAPKWGEDLTSDAERYIAKKVGNGKPVFVTRYPRSIKAFYMKETSAAETEGGRETVECFDLLVPETCEIAGGSLREHRLDQLLAAMKLRGMAVPEMEPLSIVGDKYVPRTIVKEQIAERQRQAEQAHPLGWYVDLRRWGSPPHGGFGVGFDRLLCHLTGVHTVRDMVAFPRWFGRCDC